MADQLVKFHKVVKTLLDDFEAVAGGPKLSDANLRSWAKKVVSLPTKDKRDVGEQLIAMAIRFHKSNGALARDQLIVLATCTLGKEAAVDGLAAQGLPADEARKLMEKTQTATKSLADGLAPKASGPGKKGGPGMGVGLRKGR